MKKVLAVLTVMILIAVSAGCGLAEGDPESTSKPVKPVSEIYTDITSSVTMNTLIAMEAKYMNDYFGIDISKLDEGVFYMAENPLKADTIFIAATKDSALRDSLKSSFEAMLEQRGLEAKDYDMEQYALIQEAKVVVKGNYVYVVVSPQRTQILSIIEASLG